MQQRKDEILAKKAKLAELKRQRELRQKEFSVAKHSIGSASDTQHSPSHSRTENRKELDDLISSLVGEDKGGPITPRSRPSSYAGTSRQDAGSSDGTPGSPVTLQHPASTPAAAAAAQPQTLGFSALTTIYEIKSALPKRETLTYSKGVQTSEAWVVDRSISPAPSDEESPTRDSPSKKRLSRRQREREEELRENIRKEIEQELKAVQEHRTDSGAEDGQQRQNFPARALTTEEVDAVTSSHDFLDFVERSSKVIERALDEEYDVLADYRHGLADGLDDEDEEGYGGRGKKGRRVKEVIQFFDERWSKKRMISDIGFSPKFPELVLSSYTKNPSAPYDPDGLVQVWNLHMHDRPEYIFNATSDILTAKFSPYHPNLILGGSYSGQVLLWDTRSRSAAPVQKTPLTGSGHTHPVYSINIVGTQNAHNIISTSTDGVMCSWSVDMLSHPQEYLELVAPPQQAPSASSTTTNAGGASAAATTASLFTRPDDIAPTCTAFPASDPTYFLSGTEEGAIQLCHRYDRAGAKAGVDARVAYRGHVAPVMSLDFHRATGALDLGDLMLSSSLDWTVKLWRVRTPASSANLAPTSASSSASTTAASAANKSVNGTSAHLSSLTNPQPLLDLSREDVVYDAKWSPAHPGVFACVDGAGFLEVWDLLVDSEVPVARVAPTPRNEYGAVAVPVPASMPLSPGAGGTNTPRDGILGGPAPSIASIPGNAAAAAAAANLLVPRKSLNKCAWEPVEGRRLAVGGLDGVLSVFEVGTELGGLESVKGDMWVGVKKMVNRLESKIQQSLQA